MPITAKMIAAIKRAMKQAGMNQVTLHQKSGVRRATISEILNGHQEDVLLSTLQKIAEACGCKVSDLLGE